MKMKKFVIAIFALILTSAFTEVIAVEKNGNCPPPPPSMQDKAKTRAQKEAAFEKRLGLTEEQKAQAKEIRKAGHEKLKPIMDEILAKKQEAKMVKLSRIAVRAQEEKLAVIDAELKVLEKKAHEIRKANMKEFESILTKKQKKILKEMKQEGRKRYQQDHPVPQHR